MDNNITRFEVIDHRESVANTESFGVIFTTGIDPNLSIDVFIQDDNKTMKIILSTKKEK